MLKGCFVQRKGGVSCLALRRSQSNSPVWVLRTLEVAKVRKNLGLRVSALKAKGEAKRVALLRSH